MGVGIDAVEKSSEVLDGALAYQRDIIRALCGWARSQGISDDQFVSVIATTCGIAVGALASSEAAMVQGLRFVVEQVEAAAEIAHEIRPAVKASIAAARRESH